MPIVKCPICNQTFDRAKAEYAKISSNRYAHAACALRAVAAGQKFKIPIEVIDPLDEVECKFCHQKMSKSKDEDCILIADGKYAHKKCAEADSKREKTDSEKLDDYIKQLFNIDYVYPQIRKQINDFIKNYNFSYSGIKRTLQYIYEIKHNPIEKANGRITLVQYEYQNAYNYYYAIWQAEQKNAPKIAKLDEEYIPKVVEITIDQPKRKPHKIDFFKFLDEDKE